MSVFNCLPQPSNIIPVRLMKVETLRGCNEVDHHHPTWLTSPGSISPYFDCSWAGSRHITLLLVTGRWHPTPPPTTAPPPSRNQRGDKTKIFADLLSPNFSSTATSPESHRSCWQMCGRSSSSPANTVMRRLTQPPHIAEQVTRAHWTWTGCNKLSLVPRRLLVRDVYKCSGC